MFRIPKTKLGIGCVDLGKIDKKFILDVISSNRLSYGPYSEKLEAEIARLHKRKYAIFCNSGTSALQVSVHALKREYRWQDGDEVLVPAITFIASSNVILQNGLKPVFIDVEKDYFEIDPEKIERGITKKTKAIMPVHLFGQPCDMEPILDIAQKYKLKIIEDSCETLFAKYHKVPVGSWGDVACFSTYATHIIQTGVGGIAATNSEKLAIKIKSLINHGRDGIYLAIDDDQGVSGKNLFKIVEKRFSFVDIGYSYRATELEAAIGLAQLAKKKEIIEKRKENARYLTRGLSDLSKFIKLPKIRPQTEHVFMLFPIVVVNPRISRDELTFFLEDHHVETRHLMPLLNQPIYKKIFGNLEKKYPIAQYLNKNGFLIGCHQGFSKKDLDYIIWVFHTFFKKYIRKLSSPRANKQG